MRTIDDVVRQAWEDFEAWCKKHDPDGEMTAVEAAHAYGKWCEENRK